MIFKTFDNKIDKWTSKIGIFGKSFNELGTAVNDAFKSVIDNFDNFDENVGFWESLKNNLFSKKADKDWIKNSFGDIISKENIDSYIKELDLESAKEKLADIFDWENLVKNGDATWSEYFDILKDGTEKYIPDLIKNTDDLSKLTGEDLVKANQQACASALAHNEAIKAQTFSAKAGKVALKGLAMAGNMLLMWGISKVVSAVTEKITVLANESEIAEEKASGFANSVNKSVADMSSNTSTLSELNKEYQKLSEGVNFLGKNVSLSYDEYGRYKEIISQISSIMPELTTYFDAQGNKVGFVKGQISDLNEEYEKYIQKQAQEFLVNGDENGNTFEDALTNFQKNRSKNMMENLAAGFHQFFGNYDIDDLPVNDLLDVFEELQNKSADEMADYLSDIEISNTGVILNNEGRAKAAVQSILGSPAEIRNVVGEEFNVLQQQISSYVQEFESDINSDMNKITSGLIQSAYAQDSFWALNDENARDGITTFLSSITADVWSQLGIENTHDVNIFVSEIINAFSKNKDGFSDAWNNLFSIDASEISISEYIAEIQKYMDIICDILGIKDGETRKQFMISLGFDIDVDRGMVDGLKKKLIGSDNNATSGISSVVSGYLNNVTEDEVNKWVDSLNLTELQLANSDAFTDALKEQKELLGKSVLSAEDYENALQNVKDSMERVEDATSPTFIEAFNSADFAESKEKLLELAQAGELSDTALTSAEEYVKLLEQTGLSADDAATQIRNMLTEQEKLSAASQGINSLKASYEEFKDIGFVTAQTLDSLPDVFKSLPEYDVFSQIVGNPESGEAAIRNAFNDLAGAYLLSQNTLSGLVNASESTIQTYIANLRQMGITNAEEVVNQVIAVLNTESELICAAEEGYYQMYLNYIMGKETLDNTYLNSTASKNGQLAAMLGTAYRQDYNNWCGLLSQKAIAYNEFITALGGSYDPSKDIASNMAANGKDVSALTISEGYEKAAEYAEAQREAEKAKEALELDLNPIKTTFGDTTYKPANNSKSGPKSKSGGSTESKTTINWIEKKLDRLQKKLDVTKAKFENLFSVKDKADNITKQVNQINALLKATEKAARMYKKYADDVKLSDELKEKVRTGDYSIEDYSSKTAAQISKYEDYYSKYVDLKKQAEELKTEKHQSKIEKRQLFVEEAEAKIEHSQAYAELDGADYKERNKHLEAQKKYTKESYQYQIQIAELNGDDLEASRLKAEWKKKIRDLTEEEYQNLLDGANAKIERSQAYAENDEGNAKEQNKHLEAQKKYLKESYQYQIKIAKLNGDDVEALRLKSELRKELRDLTKEKFDNIAEEYENKIGAVEDAMKLINAKMEQLEAKGYAASSAYYNQLIGQENRNLARLKEEWNILQDQLTRGMKEGTVKEGSAVWYEMVEAINEVENATIQASTSLIEYRNELRQLEWDAFDRVQDSIAEIQSEAEFLTDLMGSRKLYDDNGQWTQYADASAGLHSVSYNAYMAQADDYAREMEKISRELAADPYNTALIERRQELIRAQQEAIKSAEDEKQAIRDLVSDGYDVMADALQGIVDKRKELLDSERNLYEYEKKISKQTKDILNLEKQKLSLQGDDSEEAQAKLQQITLKLDEARDDLEESEYAQWKSDQEQMLDDLTDNVQEWVNQRLDNIDGLVSGIITSTNVNASDIRATLEQTGKEVGYTLTDEMERIWNTNSGVVSLYGDNFSSQLTSVNTTLTEIRNFVSAMLQNSNQEASASTNLDMGTLRDRFDHSMSRHDSAFSNPGTIHYAGDHETSRHSGSAGYTMTGIKVTERAHTGNLSILPSGTGVGTITNIGTKTFSDSSIKTASDSAKSFASTASSGRLSGWGSWFTKKTFSGSKGSLNKEGSIIDRLKYFDFDSSAAVRSKYYKAMGGEGTYDGTPAQNAWMINEMKKNGFQNGGRIGNPISQAGEDGMILARTGEEVLSLEKLEAIRDAASKFNPVLDRMDALLKMPEFTRVQEEQICNNNINVTFNMPNVSNYNEFFKQMQRDIRFEKMVQHMTLGNALGRNSLNKFRV